MDSNELKQYIINNDKYIEVLEGIGCYNIKEHKKFFSCSTDKNTKPFSTAVYKDNLKSNVFAEGDKVKGDIYTLTMYLKDINFNKSVRLLHKILGLKYIIKFKTNENEKDDICNLCDIFTKYKKKRRYTKEEPVILGDEISNEYIQIPYIGWVREGITPETQKLFGVGYSYKSNRVVFPHRYWCGGENDYVGLIGRTLNENYDVLGIPKYFPLHSYLKGNNIYGLQENYEGIQKAGYVTVFEAEKSVMKRHSRKDFTGTAICCHEMTEEQAKILIGLNVDIVIAMDKEVDIYEVRKICENFYGIRPIYYIWDDYNLLEDKESPADKHDKIYRVLFNRKKIYNQEEHDKFIIERNRLCESR